MRLSLEVANAHIPCKRFRRIPRSNLPQSANHKTPCSRRIIPKENHLEFAERLDSLASSGKHTENIESDL